MDEKDLKKINNYLWEIPRNFRRDMRVPARIYASEKMIGDVFKDNSLEQLVNVATLPGIVNYALAMPDMHEGYGFPIGGVAGTEIESGGVISPGGVGFDINCGARLLLSDKSREEIMPLIQNLTEQIYKDVPSGVGRGGKIKLDKSSLNEVLEKGVDYLVKKGYADKEDKENCEENGSMRGADASLVSERAKNRGRDQLGTLGSGNHFLEIQYVEEIFDKSLAKSFGLEKGQITIMIHCGSRGLGHQVCSDYVRVFLADLMKKGIKLPDRELAYAPFNSPLGKRYFSAMAASANFAWANRQAITHLVRNSWKKVIGEGELKLLYDVAHNIAKIEEHEYKNEKGEMKTDKLCVHRKGATRCFGPNRKELSEKYRSTGQPVLIPGSMGTASYVLAGTEKAMKESFGSACHGAGRTMSRHEALRQTRGTDVRDSLRKKGIFVYSGSIKGIAEEAPIAYKDIDDVVETVSMAGLAKKVARLRPMGVVKG